MTHRSYALLLALTCAPLLGACTGPNPASCVANSKVCAAGKTCDTATGLCVDRDASVADANDAGDSAGGDGTGDAGYDVAAAAIGEPCASAAACASGHCADGVCCNTACTGACSSCALTTLKGTCSPVKNADDPDSCTPAPSTTCDASGTCKLRNAAACGGGAECASGLCADGVCCNTGCTESCHSCSLPGAAGTCSPIKNGEDLDTCSGTYTCSSAGQCRLKDTQSCTANENCASSICGRFYRDADRDGYGDMTISSTFCTAAPTSTPPWATRGDDCCDMDPKVYPGQMDYQPSPSAPCGAIWDYDCSGADDREYPYPFSCANDGFGGCATTALDGWSGTIPVCGSTGTLNRCGAGTCGPTACCMVVSSMSSVTQRCR